MLAAAVQRVEALPSTKSVDDDTRWVKRAAAIAAIKGDQA
jgi:cell division protein FtsX